MFIIFLVWWIGYSISLCLLIEDKDCVVYDENFILYKIIKSILWPIFAPISLFRKIFKYSRH